ncbi:SusC/RagA family TonB-linked outer membrane protein [Aquimarina sp. TRL1]|uniref:SusC/RagA family TonB-linked outer membrane protein n=1 Tax=Aquimarina sp. (strain TRL1) TaxID=2736252 RepID=UPI00158BB051|nr:SusC/RagA family TonB-linked outer membrane protein [Aquimarina sp. TRL1]QKX05410.1 SusC/RagA family TonB-linked outer membrane protein [Aquimarina sp. TRL1]
MRKDLKYIFFCYCFIMVGTLPIEAKNYSKSRPLSEILDELGQKYKVFFTYNSAKLDNVLIDFDVNDNEKIEVTIKRLLKKTNFNYKSFENKYYVVYENTKRGRKYLEKALYHLSEIEKLEKEGVHINKKGKKRSLSSQRNGAQGFTVNGTVKDKNGYPLMGASVLVKGTNQGGVTDFNGVFSLILTNNRAILEISYVGFEDKEIQIKGRSTIEIVLEEDTSALEEVVVVGYGSKAKREIAGAITQVEFDELENTSIQSFDKAIQGRATGVQIVNSGAPGGATQVRIRGIGSINSGNNPLYIVDGVQVVQGQFSQVNTQENVLSTINPNDIVSIDILKDASASIYGAQAANGVVIITTKRGSTGGKTKINLNAHWGINSVINRLDLLTGPEWTALVLEGYANRYGTNSNQYQDQLAFLGNPSDAPNYDWQDLLFTTALVSNYQLSVSGGAERTRYFASGSYNKTEGHVIGTGFERGTLRFNLDNGLGTKFRTSLSTNFSLTQNQATRDDGFFFNNPAIASAFIVPTNNPYDEDGTIREPLFGLYSENPLVNKVPSLFDESSTTYKILSSFSSDYEFSKNFIYTSKFGLDFLTNNYKYFASPKANVGASSNGEIVTSNNRNLNWQIDQLLTYDKMFNDVHKFDALVGVNYRQEKRNFFSATGTEFIVSSLTSEGNASVQQIDGFDTEWRMASVFGRINYVFDDRYIFSGTIRRDGVSRFGKDNRWGTFPAISLGWLISSEKFMSRFQDAITELKIRGSYGVTGNANVDNFASRGFFATSTFVGRGALLPDTVANPNLAWEESETFNIGFDAKLFDGRVEASADYYTRTTNDLLLERPLATTSGYNRVFDNVGEIENKGIELSLNMINIKTKNFRWSTGFNLSMVHNEVKALSGEVEQINDDDFGLVHRVGESLGSWYAIRWAGVNPADGRPMYYDRNGELTFNPTDDDRIVVGGSIPTYYGGFTNNFSYKGLSLSVLFQYSGGNYIRNRLAFSTRASGSFADRNQQRSELNRWQKPGDITDVPIALNGFVYDARPGNAYSSKHIEKGDYIRMKQINISYDFPELLLKNLNLQSMTVYLSGNNLFTYTPYSGRDPELLGGDDTGDYPQAKSYILGVNIGF